MVQSFALFGNPKFLTLLVIYYAHLHGRSAVGSVAQRLQSNRLRVAGSVTVQQASGLLLAACTLAGVHSCAVLCRAVLHCAVLCRAVLNGAEPCRAVLNGAVLC